MESISTSAYFLSFSSHLGKITVVEYQAKIVAIFMGNHSSYIQNHLLEEAKNNLLLTKTKAIILNYLKNPNDSLKKINISPYGTPFQQKVWQALQTIPIGEVRSYKEIACMIAAHRAIRATANACAQNPIALVIPCHRIVYSGGTISPYRWGKRIKERLLSLEKTYVVNRVDNSLK